MKIISIIPILVCFAFASPVAAIQDSEESRERPPNIVIIFTDDQGWGDLSCYGSEEIPTPNIDRLAKEGMQFNNFYTSQPVCSAARASLLTGCLPIVLGSLEHSFRPPRSDSTPMR